MASKNLHIISGLDGTHLRTIPVFDSTRIQDIQRRCHEKGKGLVTLLRGVQGLEPRTTVGEAGLEDGEELSLLWSKKYYETARLDGTELREQSVILDQYIDLLGDIYVQIPQMLIALRILLLKTTQS